MTPNTTLSSTTRLQNELSSYVIADYIVAVALAVSVQQDDPVYISSFVRSLQAHVYDIFLGIQADVELVKKGFSFSTCLNFLTR